MHAGMGIELLPIPTSGLCRAAVGMLVEYIQYVCVFVCLCMYIGVSGSGAFY